MKKTGIKLTLDALMALTLFLLYSKNAISMSFHEIAGLAICGAFLIHKALNFAWIKTVTRRLFDRKLPARTKLGWAVDALLAVCFLFIAVSGVLISKTILTGISASGRIWKTGHYFAAALSIALIGVHIGLHVPMLAALLRKRVRLPKWAGRAVAAVLVLGILGFGGWQMATGSFGAWLAGPFTGASEGEHRLSESTEGGVRTEAPDGVGRGQGGSGKGLGRGNGAGGGGYEKLHAEGGTGSFARAAGTFASYASIAGVFAVLTAGALSLGKKRAKPEQKSCEPMAEITQSEETNP